MILLPSTWARETTATLIRIVHKLNALEELVMTDQEHLDTDIASLTAAVATIVSELKAQPGAAALDFTKADAFVANTQAEAAADAPPAPTPPPAV